MIDENNQFKKFSPNITKLRYFSYFLNYHNYFKNIQVANLEQHGVEQHALVKLDGPYSEIVVTRDLILRDYSLILEPIAKAKTDN
jgi:hypothetical protein